MKKNKMITVIVAAIILLSSLGIAQEDEKDENKSEIDIFMEKVLDKRKFNWDQLYNYIFTEKDTFKLIGDIKDPSLQTYTGEWRWRVKEGFMVRSPFKVNGVEVSQDEREKAEAEWIEERKKQKEKEDRKKQGLPPLKEEEESPDSGDDKREVFFGMKTGEGSFFFAGKKVIDGRELVVVEYYPKEMIKVDDKHEKMNEEDKARTIRFTKGLNNAAKVIFYIKADEYQIVEMAINIRELDFLPARWLVHFHGVQAKMRWEKPLDDTWMPVEITARGSASMAVGKIILAYRKEFTDYRKTQVKVNFKFDPSLLGEGETTDKQEGEDEK